MSNVGGIFIVILLIIFGTIVLIISVHCLIWIIVVLSNIVSEIIKPFMYACFKRIKNDCGCTHIKNSNTENTVVLCIINEECAICITDNNSNSISLKCSHGYHSDCIRGWVRQCNKQENIPRCPLCKDHIMLDMSNIILGNT